VDLSSDTHHEMTINTWTDRIVGSACGDGIVLAKLIGDFLNNREENDGKYSNKAAENAFMETHSHPPIIIRLAGSLRFMDPSKEVWSFLQGRSLRWQLRDSAKMSSTPHFRVAAHIRVPEDFCPQFWKDDNNVMRLLSALDEMKEYGLEAEKCDLDVYTEDRFTDADEDILRRRYKNARIHRGSPETLLHDVKRMATSDVFVPSSSHLSAIAGYLSHGLIWISHESRWGYFDTHRGLGCNLRKDTLTRDQD
jgi:hypothetical protein